MKKLGIASALFLVSTASGIPVAHALDVTALIVAIPVAIGEYSTAAVLLPTGTTEGTPQDANDKAVYYQSLRDEAGAEIAVGGAPTAVLQDAINQIRAQTGTQLSPRDISIQIMKALN
jgi:hypothetical protein